MNAVDPRYDYFQEYQHDLNARGLRLDNWLLHMYQTGRFLRWLWARNLDLPEVSTEVINNYFRYRKAKGHRHSTLVKVAWVIRDFFDFAVRDELIPRNPMVGFSHSNVCCKTKKTFRHNVKGSFPKAPSSKGTELSS